MDVPLFQGFQFQVFFSGTFAVKFLFHIDMLVVVQFYQAEPKLPGISEIDQHRKFPARHHFPAKGNTQRWCLDGIQDNPAIFRTITSGILPDGFQAPFAGNHVIAAGFLSRGLKTLFFFLPEAGNFFNYIGGNHIAPVFFLQPEQGGQVQAVGRPYVTVGLYKIEAFKGGIHQR